MVHGQPRKSREDGHGRPARRHPDPRRLPASASGWMATDRRPAPPRSSPLAGECFRLDGHGHGRPSAIPILAACRRVLQVGWPRTGRPRAIPDPRRLPASASGWMATDGRPGAIPILAACRRVLQVGWPRTGRAHAPPRSSPLVGESKQLDPVRLSAPRLSAPGRERRLACPGRLGDCSTKPPTDPALVPVVSAFTDQDRPGGAAGLSSGSFDIAVDSHGLPRA